MPTKPYEYTEEQHKLRMEQQKVRRKKRRRDGTVEILIWNVPKKLRDRFKQECKNNDQTMRDALVISMEQYVSDERNLHRYA